MQTTKIKPLFFVHTIDPILWVFLMVFIRPFFRIACFQYTGIKEIGFKRLEISSLSAQEFEDCNIAGLEFSKANDFAELCAIHGRLTTHELDFTNYFAKEILRSYTDLLLSAKMIRKLENPTGIFILTRQFFGRELRHRVVESVEKASGLRCAKNWWMIIRWLQIPFRIILAFFTFWAGVVALLLNKRKTPRIELDGKIVVVANNPSELQPDVLRQLSVGFMIDEKTITKEDVLFLARRGPEAGQWRKEGFCVHNLVDLAGRWVHAQTIWNLLVFFITQPRLTVGLIVFFPPWVMYYLVLSDLLVSQHKFRGLIYTNSDVAIEPIFSVPFLARHIPVVLFYYSASTFANSMWAFLQADHIFVWNNNMIEFLKGHPQDAHKKFFVSGPLMQVEDSFLEGQIQNLRTEFKIPYEMGKTNIGVFDIAPVKADYLEQARFVQNPKLTRELHRDFLFDIFSLADDDPNVRMMLKPKRWTAKHDLAPEISQYLENNAGKTILLPPSLNPQIAIQSCNVVICFPFTSIFFAALQKGIPAIFYYPIEDSGLKKVKELQEFTIYGKENLATWFKEFRRQAMIPPPEKIKELCAVANGEAIRKRFISQLSEIL